MQSTPLYSDKRVREAEHGTCIGSCKYIIMGEQLTEFSDGEHKTSRYIKAIAVLWIEFVREVRWCWEESQSLPQMLANGLLDLSTCLINQKLHMLAICIEKKRQLNEDFQDCIGSEDQSDTISPVAVRKVLLAMRHPISRIQLKIFLGKLTDELRNFSISDDSHSSGRIIAIDGRKPEDASLPTNKKPSECSRRMCPGISFALPSMEFPLAHLLYHFNWELPNGMKPEELDMTEYSGIVVGRKNNLYF
ncbi:rab3 GTPase-activating protein catalytic subunit isoform X1 [Senna tora]|uniref:Rab3 GTPase-activating protein catalytic subunit isoform X1 n=1 Tax=Senna tora TaxID=362788 RepID=A0A834SG43_9FABA|nr:rab3 GTPase-activating protein catalytic subunit isoform X1 [Senna tora]